MGGHGAAAARGAVGALESVGHRAYGRGQQVCESFAGTLAGILYIGDNVPVFRSHMQQGLGAR